MLGGWGLGRGRLSVWRLGVEGSRGARRYAAAPAELREYQQHVIDRCLQRIRSARDIEAGKRRVRLGVSLATGGGKTVIFSNLIKQLHALGEHERTLVLVHRRELAQQAASTIRRFMPECNIQVEMGRATVSELPARGPTVVIASVQSLVRRLDRYGADSFDLIVVDEAHHAVAESYLRILDHFDQDVPMVGFSATFERADHKALSTVVDEIIYHRGILEMITDKWLCEGKFTQVKVDYDLSGVEISSASNDFKLDKLSRIMNTEHVNEIIVKTYLHRSQQSEKEFQSTLLFAVDISHVQSLQKKFEGSGIRVSSVTSMTKTADRDQIIGEFKSGKIQVLINCGIFTEGTDMPNIDCILLCRPTRSRGLLVQMIGRGLRLHHSKTHCNIIDFVGASDVGVVSIPTLAGIERFENTLEDATMEDLMEIKKDMQFKEKIENENNMQAQKSLKRFIDQVSALDLTLSTFDSFQSYHEYRSKGELQKNTCSSSNELDVFYNSKYPWVRFADNAWGLSLQNSHHLRIYRKNAIYTLKLYREIPPYLRDATKTKFIPRELVADESLLRVIGKVEEVMRNLADQGNTSSNLKVNNLTKYTKWRYEMATVKQRDTIKKRLATKSSEYALQSDQIAKFLEKLTKGEASNFLFACTLAPVYPIKSLLQALKFKTSL